MRCRQEGHVQRDCPNTPNAWGTVGGGPVSGSVDPTPAEAHSADVSSVPTPPVLPQPSAIIAPSSEAAAVVEIRHEGFVPIPPSPQSQSILTGLVPPAPGSSIGAFSSSASVLSDPYSDHSALHLSWSLSPVPPPGPSFWKLNTSILSEDNYFQLISDFWFSWQRRHQHFSSLLNWWEEGKSCIKGLSIKYCKSRSNCKSLERSILSNLASHLKSLVDSGRSSLQHIYNNTLSRLKALDLEIARGLQTRSRIKWVEEGESSSAFFLRLVKRNSVDRSITALRADDGSVTSDQEGLSRLLCSFYSDLFSASPCDPVAQASLLSNVSVKLSPAESLVCEGPLSRGECFAALQGMARGRTPGCDGAALTRSVFSL